MAEDFGWLNPHLTLSVGWNGKCEIEFKAVIWVPFFTFEGSQT
jgi:hypothetical protein